MRKKPEERYQSAGEVIEEFAKHASDTGEETTGSAEATYELPEVTARISASGATTEASLERSQPHPPAPPPPPPQSWQQADLPQQPQQEAPGGTKPALQLTGLHNALKTGVHFALTMAGTGCFILSGASGSAAASFSSPFTSNPVTAGLLALAGIVLYGWAMWQKPYKFTPGYAFFAATAAAAAYSGGAFIPAPEGADTITKGFLALTIGMENMFSGANLIVYSLFFYLAASKAVFKNWGLKAFAVVAYLAGLALTYTYFKAGAEISPETTLLAVGGILALLGLVAALTQKNFSLLFNPQLFFLGANLAMFAMFTNPQIGAITAQKERAEKKIADSANLLNRQRYQQALMAAQSEILYDEEGRPLEPKMPAKPAEVKPPERGKLQNQARIEYYKLLTLRISGTLAGSAGIIFIAFFLALMANACFLDELAAYYSRRELF
jgi:hypothetical protein